MKRCSRLLICSKPETSHKSRCAFSPLVTNVLAQVPGKASERIQYFSLIKGIFCTQTGISEIYFFLFVAPWLILIAWVGCIFFTVVISIFALKSIQTFNFFLMSSLMAASRHIITHNKTVTITELRCAACYRQSHPEPSWIHWTIPGTEDGHQEWEKLYRWTN